MDSGDASMFEKFLLNNLLDWLPIDLEIKVIPKCKKILFIFFVKARAKQGVAKAEFVRKIIEGFQYCEVATLNTKISNLIVLLPNLKKCFQSSKSFTRFLFNRGTILKSQHSVYGNINLNSLSDFSIEFIDLKLIASFLQILLHFSFVIKFPRFHGF